MTALDRDISYFKVAVALSVTFHLTLLLAALFSPQLPKPPRKEMIHYVNLVSLPGGGGSGGGGGRGGGEKIAETPLPKKETLKDLTTPQKISEEPSSSLRHPVEKPKKEAKPKPEKKAAIQKQETSGEPGVPGAKAEAEAEGGGGGSGIRIGGGGGEGSEVSGSSFASQVGLSSFPYTYYLQIIIDRVSSQWFTSLVDPGISGTFQATAYFKILRSGQVSELKIQESSGVQSLDMSALRAIRSAAPFPPLPRDYEGEHLVIYLIFEHSK